MSAEAFGEGGSNPESFRGGILDCFVARAPRNDEEERASATLRSLVPRTQRSVPPAMRSIVRCDDALPSRRPSIRNRRVAWGPGSAPQRPTRCSLSGTRAMCIASRGAATDSLPVCPPVVQSGCSVPSERSQVVDRHFSEVST
ncbi:hypothetical protein EOW77_0007960 [Bradyrhizobium yuanmingense]|nr:hypothetical protein EOW77_0007960 [Bradyrhizobium yuanmingense]